MPDGPDRQLPTVLILSVGSLLGSNLLDALDEFRDRIRVLGLHTEVAAVNDFRCDRVWLGKPASDREAYRSRVAELV